MAKMKLVLVQSSCGSPELVPLNDPLQTVDVELDPDNALERVRAYFDERWSAQVHALRWIFPRDCLLPAKDDAPFLVLYVDDPGRLIASSSNHIQDNPAARGVCSTMSCPDSGPILLAATRPSRSEPWSDPLWMKETSEWICSTFGRHKVQRISQVRSSMNGAVLRIDTPDCGYFMKTAPARVSFERPLLQWLHQNLPGACPPVLDVCPDNQTHITRAAEGLPLRLIHDPGQWIAAFQRVAEYQYRSVSYVTEMKSLGVPCQNLGEFSASLEQCLSQLIDLQMGVSGELTRRELDRIPALITKAQQDTQVLGDCGIPEGLVHGDLNESNLFCSADGTTSLIDWTFSRIEHPFFALGFSLFAAADPGHRMHSISSELRQAYAGPWRRYAGSHTLLAGLDSASRLFWIDTAQTIGSLVLEIRDELPGAAAHLPAVLRRSLSAFGLSA